jgi:23S rRNA pseudouridine2605 synthase
MDAIRLQLFISKCGVCSRRKAEELIQQGRVSVNGRKVSKPYMKVIPFRDKVFLDGNLIEIKDNVYLMLNKPPGVTTTKKDPFSQDTVMDLLPEKFRYLNPVGRLDRDTSGLLLFTNDGEFTLKFTHPRYRVVKVYIAEIDRPLTKRDKDFLEKGVFIEDYRTAPCKINILSGSRVKLCVYEGKKRQIRLMFKQKGYTVERLERIKEGFFILGKLAPGKFRLASLKEKEKIRRFLRDEFR